MALLTSWFRYDPRLNEILSYVRMILEGVTTLSGTTSQLDNDIQQLKQDVAALTSTVQAAVTLIGGFAAQLLQATQQAASAGATPEQLQSLTDLHTVIAAETQSLAQAVAQNTPSNSSAAGNGQPTAGNGQQAAASGSVSWCCGVRIRNRKRRHIRGLHGSRLGMAHTLAPHPGLVVTSSRLPGDHRAHSGAGVFPGRAALGTALLAASDNDLGFGPICLARHLGVAGNRPGLCDNRQ
jgi:hypothetical protein